jgi:hypothetical protein
MIQETNNKLHGRPDCWLIPKYFSIVRKDCIDCKYYEECKKQVIKENHIK